MVAVEDQSTPDPGFEGSNLVTAETGNRPNNPEAVFIVVCDPSMNEL
jgi:hypothetical protein